jgi:hypothetical protein
MMKICSPTPKFIHIDGYLPYGFGIDKEEDKIEDNQIKFEKLMENQEGLK